MLFPRQKVQVVSGDGEGVGEFSQAIAGSSTQTTFALACCKRCQAYGDCEFFSWGLTSEECQLRRAREYGSKAVGVLSVVVTPRKG